MNDILIRGMEMPINEPLLVKINPDGSVSKLWRDVFLEYANCKAFSVPPHGRCIDADALVMENYGQYGAIDALALEVIKAAPTIIPAEEGK